MEKLLEEPCPICKHDYQYIDDNGDIWCPHCGATKIKENEVFNPVPHKEK
jgi:uncharacterized Zn finger protein (UPF0148 family)